MHYAYSEYGCSSQQTSGGMLYSLLIMDVNPTLVRNFLDKRQFLNMIKLLITVNTVL